MQRIAAGDAQAFRALSSVHLKPILTYCSRVLRDSAEAEEVAQEVMLRAWQGASNYEPRARLTTWLHRMAHNLAIDVLRRRHGSTDWETESLVVPDSQAPGRLVEQHDTALRVHRALDMLPERQRQALLLCHEQGLTNPEIGEVFGVGVAAVESLLGRGRKALRAALAPTMEHADD